ncbi:MAG: DNA helicase PcrA [Firmicutes bacterium]|nr:DNA helicase PcrA [Bacillota bacterium]
MGADRLALASERQSLPAAQVILEALNEAQRQAVITTEGPVLIVAGAGSGKTRVLTHRIAYLLAAKRVAPWSILAITFTNKAAREMQERVQALCGMASKEIWVMTFHAFCVRILRREIERLGYGRHFTIEDTADQLATMKAVLKELDLDPKRNEPRSLLNKISTLKNELKTPQAIEGDNFGNQLLRHVYDAYQRRLKQANALDFDDLIMLTVTLFQQFPEVLEHYQDQFRYIHVDEYQDTNRAQYTLVRLLAAKYRNLCVVGDSDQSIYGWRGADIRNMLDFERDYPDAAVVKLEQNYRSTQRILDAANQVIAHNRSRQPKRLWTQNGEGALLYHYLADNEQDEARFVVQTIARAVGKGRAYRDFAILYRTNAQSRALEEALMVAGMPYAMVGGLRFYERKEIKDALAYLRLIANPDDDAAFLRAIQVPKRGIVETTLQRLSQQAAAQGLSLWALCNSGNVDKSSRKKTLDRFIAWMTTLHAAAAQQPPSELLDRVLEESGYAEMLRQEHTDEAAARLENLDELRSAALEYEHETADSSLEGFLADLALATDVDRWDADQDAVLLMTMHAAKGLEFPVVFLVGMEEGIFPHQRALFDAEEMEEERRLCYVAITRAKKELFLTHARMRTLYGQTNYAEPSRFLDEISAELIEERGVTSVSVQRQESGRRTWMAEQEPAKATEVVPFALGEKVRHPKWGLGTVVAQSGAGNDLQVVVAFEGIGTKRLLASYAHLQRLEGECE